MNVKELMVFDKVRYIGHHVIPHGSVVTVTTIEATGEVCICTPETYIYTKCEALEPINPTDEIMQANGFKNSEALPNRWTRNFGEKTVTVYLHDCLGKFYAFDYWIEQPWDSTTKQTMYCQVWRKTADLKPIILDMYEKHLDAGDAHGLHILQHAMQQAEIEYEWIINNE